MCVASALIEQCSQMEKAGESQSKVSMTNLKRQNLFSVCPRKQLLLSDVTIDFYFKLLLSAPRVPGYM